MKRWILKGTYVKKDNENEKPLLPVAFSPLIGTCVLDLCI